ncbi:MAG: prephenate dehydrogenase/arogenate dehydrogenase family protein [Desulfobacterales bacterium]|nr:prephenate dehydrogenase/arogenate dehydrogenase family protein [Desulfobacterales bacterium]MDX2511536.1 prephenate dehydrogenase/arogenate dehydrogenase family protein [Desulfobacterales bacterium]
MIGILGFGRFGKLMAQYLARDFDVLVYNRSDNADAIIASGAKPASLEEVCRQKMIILSVPISVFRVTLETVAPLLNPDALVIDVCSVKEYPVRLMKDLLPEGVSILATHPMFGPDSAADALQGRKIVLCAERINDSVYQKIKSYLMSKGLVVIEATPEAHDRQIAVSLALTHFIGRSLAEFGATPLDVDTEGYQRLLHVLGVVENDTWQLFEDMNTYNPYAAESRSEFMAAVERIHQRLPGAPG